MHDLCLRRDHPQFPQRLTGIPDPPHQVWVRGTPGHLPRPDEAAIALVGSRAASHDGLHVARHLARELARAGVIIVSGLARGIDAAAHEGALDAAGRTVAVLGSGLQRLYPPEHAGLAQRMLPAGAVLSEYPPHTAPHPGLFPPRNRLVSGLADAVIVVEAAERSGALITAGAALDQGKDVFVVPGRVAGGRNRGGHLLIRDGARLVESAEDVLRDLDLFGAQHRPDRAATRLPELLEFTLDDEVQATGETASGVLARLLKEELDGRIRRIGSGRFLRLRSRVLT
jgi:DNA processing protein